MQELERVGGTVSSCGSLCACTANRCPCLCVCCPPDCSPCCTTSTRCTRSARTASSSADGLLWQRQHRNDSSSSDWSCCCRRHCGAVCVQVESALVKPGQTLNADNLVTFWAPRPPASCRGQSADGCRSCSGLVLSEILAVSGACRQLRWALFALVPSRDATTAAQTNGGLKVWGCFVGGPRRPFVEDGRSAPTSGRQVSILCFPRAPFPT